MVVLVLVLGGDDEAASQKPEAIPGQPTIDIIAPRNGSRQENRSVVVRIRVENFQLAPEHFGGDPLLGEGHLRFSLNRVPDCVDPEKLQKALNSPTGRGRFLGRSFDYPKYSGPNGLLALLAGSAGLYSPSTQPEIFYERLPPGFYRLTINLALNDGSPTPYNAVTNFEILSDVWGDETPAGVSVLEEDCPEGKIASADAVQQRR
ncbi:MAG TPA: hypothetical protein VEG34_13305 [Thermoanaerobaculia bacterium]|nr:hypothetical protein [Thermoanaerobaculia bacterium]